jgi:ribose transport system permease protein
MKPVKNVNPPQVEPKSPSPRQSLRGALQGLAGGRFGLGGDREGAGDQTRAPVVYGAVHGLLQIGPALILALLFVVMTIASPFFFTERNLQNLGFQSSIVAALALGQLFVIVTRGIDISVGSVLALSGVVGIAFGGLGTASGASVVLVILLTGGAVGLLNALFIVKGRLPQPLIVTLATLGMARGLALLITDGETDTNVPSIVIEAGTGFVGPIPLPVVLIGCLGVVLHVFATRTRWGRWIFATGGNPEAARELGLPVDRIIMSVFIFSGFAAGFAAILSVGRTGSASPFAGELLELDAITAVIIGGASLFGGRGSVGGVLVGALILGTIRNGLDLLSVSPYWQTIAIGAIVLLALELDMIRGRLEQRMRSLRSREVE